LSRYFIKIDEFPDPINAAIFSTSKVVSFYERNKKNKKIVCLHLMFSHFHNTAKNKKKVCQNAHLHYFTYKAPTFTSWGFVIT